ncbi:MAG: hypothetical protein Q9223_001169 [Gallowayella weberi]
MASVTSPSPPSSPSIHGALRSYPISFSSTQSPLLNLPPELRLMIYNYVFTTPQTIVPKPDKAYCELEVFYSGVRLDGILVACRQLYAETCHIFYDRTRFVFESRYITIPRAMDAFSQKIGTTNMGKIHEIFIIREEDPLRWTDASDPNSRFRLGKPMGWAQKFQGLKALRLVYTKPLSSFMFSRLRMPQWGFRALVQEQPGLRDFLEEVTVRVEVKICDKEGVSLTKINAGSWISGKLNPKGNAFTFSRLGKSKHGSRIVDAWEIIVAARRANAPKPPPRHRNSDSDSGGDIMNS